MRAAELGPDGTVTVARAPLPEPGPGEVLVEVRSCVLSAPGPAVAGGGRGSPPGGGEFAGVVHSTGDGVEAFAPGDRVATVVTETSAPVTGGLAEFALAGESALTRVDARIPDAAAAQLATATIAWEAVTRANVLPGDTVCIVGAGALGLSVMRLVQGMHPGAVYVVEPRPVRRRRALELGATRAFGRDENVAGLLIEELEAGGADIVFDCAGQPSTLQFASVLARGGGGRVVMAAWYDGPDSIEPNAVIKEADILGAIPSEESVARATADVARDQGSSLQALVSRVIGLAEIEGALASLKDPETPDLRILVDPRA